MIICLENNNQDLFIDAFNLIRSLLLSLTNYKEIYKTIKSAIQNRSFYFSYFQQWYTINVKNTNNTVRLFSFLSKLLYSYRNNINLVTTPFSWMAETPLVISHMAISRVPDRTIPVQYIYIE